MSKYNVTIEITFNFDCYTESKRKAMIEACEFISTIEENCDEIAKQNVMIEEVRGNDEYK